MNKKMLTYALFATMLGTLATSCQKETLFESQTPNAESYAMYTMVYGVNGVQYYSSLNSESELDELIYQLIELSETSSAVDFALYNYTFGLSKETLHYNTSDINKAVAWSKQKALQGYRIYVTYDEDNNTYCLSAVK